MPHGRDDRSQALAKSCRPSLTIRLEFSAGRCCIAKYRLHANDRSPRLCIAAMRSLTALSAFLDVSSLNLTAPQAPSFFSPCSILGRRANGVREPCDEAGDAVADCGEAGQPL